MGADSGIHITTPESTVVEPISVAHAIKAVIEKNKYDLVIMGKQAIDDDSGSTGGMLAGMLGWGQGSFTSKLTVEEGGKVEITREIDGGLEKLEGKLPMIVTTDLRWVFRPVGQHEIGADFRLLVRLNGKPYPYETSSELTHVTRTAICLST